MTANQNRITITKLSYRLAPKATEYNKIFNTVKKLFRDKEITFIELDSLEDCDKYEELIYEHNISGVPCLIIEQEGREATYLEGNQSLATLEDFINNLLGIKSKYLANSLDKYPKIGVGIYDVVWIGNDIYYEDEKNNLSFEIELDRNAPSAVYPCRMQVFADGSVKIRTW